MLSINQISNGLTLIIEEMPHFESVAYNLSIPGGIVLDGENEIGASLILGELITKGAGPLDSKSLSNAFEECGIRHGEGAGHDRFTFRGQATSEYLKRALELVCLMITEPTLPESEIKNIKNLYLQDIKNLVDHPARRAGLMLSERYFPQPHARPGIGTTEGITSVSAADLRNKWKEQFAPRGAVLSIAGNVKKDETLTLCENLFAKWIGNAGEIPKYGEFPAHDNFHIQDESAQLQIVLAYPSAKFNDKHYYTAKIANQILSGGMFGRLFIEVREKRGLCYSVYSQHSATTEYGMVQAYAGTTPERAHETLDVMLGELKRLKGSVTSEEITRAKANLKASLIIGGESPGSRSSSNSGDWWVDKKVRTLTEVINAVDKVSINDINEYVEEYPADSHMLLTLGKRDLKSK
jgi:predicted Zn-dependent peptidase